MDTWQQSFWLKILSGQQAEPAHRLLMVCGKSLVKSTVTQYCPKSGNEIQQKGHEALVIFARNPGTVHLI